MGIIEENVLSKVSVYGVNVCNSQESDLKKLLKYYSIYEDKTLWTYWVLFMLRWLSLPVFEYLLLIFLWELWMEKKEGKEGVRICIYVIIKKGAGNLVPFSNMDCVNIWVIVNRLFL